MKTNRLSTTSRLSALIAIAGIGLGVALTPAQAETRPEPKGPPKTMGSEGKLPATSTIGSHVPNMGSTDAPASSSDDPTGPKGPPKRMGDEGTLPATGTMGGAVPRMQNDQQQ